MRVLEWEYWNESMEVLEWEYWNESIGMGNGSIEMRVDIE